MDLTEGIRKIGFRRWYERQLIESHLYLISGVLCLFTSMASLEGFNLRLPAWEILLRLCAMVGGTAFCLWTWRRYLMMLGVAEHAAERSVCEKCETYRGLELSRNAAHEAGGSVEGVLSPVGVRCRRCGHEWTIE
jgi:hypothetical protein